MVVHHKVEKITGANSWRRARSCASLLNVAGVMLAATRSAQRVHNTAAARKPTGRNGFNRATWSKVQ
jgi:hypothetical protein